MAIAKMKKWMAYLNNKTDERAFLKCVLESNKQHLKSGTYGFTFTDKRKIFLKDKAASEFLQKNKDQANQSLLGEVKHAIDSVTSNFFTMDVVNLNEAGVKGDLVMVTYNHNVKIFDFSSKLILNKFTHDHATYQNIKQAYQALNRHLDMTIIEFLDHEHAYLEKYLEFIPYKRWSQNQLNKCIDCIFSSYREYFSSVPKEAVERLDALAVLYNVKAGPYGTHKLFRDLERMLEGTSMETIFPVIRAHGDMKFENILLCRDNFCFIDLEFSDDFFFFYDVMNFSFIEALKGDYSFLACYLNGEFDEPFHLLFAEFDMEFDKSQKLFYFAAFLIDRFCHFDLQKMKGRLDMEEVLDQYNAVWEKSRKRISAS